MFGQTKFWILVGVAILAFIFHPSTKTATLTKTVPLEKQTVFEILKDPYGFLQLHPNAVEVKVINQENGADYEFVVFDLTETFALGKATTRLVLSNDKKNKITLETNTTYSIVYTYITWELSNIDNKVTLIKEDFTINAPWITRGKVLQIIKDAHSHMLQTLESMDTVNR